MKTTHILAILVAAALAACASPSGAPPAAEKEAETQSTPIYGPPPPAPKVEAPRAPFLLHLEGPQAVMAGGEADVVARIVRSVPNAVPIDLVVKPKDGISLLKGSAEERIVDDHSQEIVRTFHLRVDDPGAEIEVTASMGGEGFGATSTKRFRFLREAPKPRTSPRPGGVVERAR